MIKFIDRWRYVIRVIFMWDVEIYKNSTESHIFFKNHDLKIAVTGL